MRYELKTIPVWPLIKVTFALSLVGGFILGLFYALLVGLWVSVLSKLGPLSGQELDLDGATLGVLMIFLPFLFAILGSVVNTIMAMVIGFIYNLFAKVMGGLELELQLVPVTPAAAKESSLDNMPGPSVPPPPPPVVSHTLPEPRRPEPPTASEPAPPPESEPFSPPPERDWRDSSDSQDSSNT